MVVVLTLGTLGVLAVLVVVVPVVAVVPVVPVVAVVVVAVVPVVVVVVALVCDAAKAFAARPRERAATKMSLFMFVFLKVIRYKKVNINVSFYIKSMDILRQNCCAQIYFHTS